VDGDGFDEGVDCDDTDPAVHPGAAELCNGRDDDCDTIVDPFLRVPEDHTTIQAAIDGASAGDVVCVSEGTYVERIDFGGKDVSVIGAGGAEATVIDGGGVGPVVTFQSGETDAALLRGFSVTGATGFWNYQPAVAINGAAPTLEDLELRDNACDYNYGCYALGVSVRDGGATMRRVVIRDNVGDPNYQGSAYGIGATFAYATVSMEDVTFARNVAVAQYPGAWAAAAGIHAAASTITLHNVVFADNRVEGAKVCGAAIFATRSTVEVTNALFAGNESAGEDCGGAAVHAHDGTLSLTNTTVVGNSLDGGPGMGVLGADEATLSLVNTIVAYDNPLSTPLVAVYDVGGSEIAMSWSDLYGSGDRVSGLADPTGIDRNISVDPLFVDTSAAEAIDWDLRLDAASPLVDAGDPSILDVDGTTSDIGAYGGPGGESW